MLTPAELREWLTHPITEKLLGMLRKEYTIAEQQILNGSLLQGDKPLERYNELLGFIRGVKLILDSDLIEEIQNEFT